MSMVSPSFFGRILACVPLPRVFSTSVVTIKSATPKPGLFTFSPTLHGAKKKAAAANASSGPSSNAPTQEGADHVFNIYTGRKDAAILPDKFYPKWLWDMLKPVESYGELSMMFVHGHKIEESTFRQFRRFTRLHRKYLIKLNNIRLKRSSQSSDPILMDS